MSNPHIVALQRGLGVTPDGKRGPITDRAIIAAADAGRLVVKGQLPPPPQAIINPPVGNIPSSGVAKLIGVHPALADLIRNASARCDVPFTVIEGVRTADRQRELVARGASKTMNSRHLTGHAIDLWPLDPATGKALPSGTKAAEARLWADLTAISRVVLETAKERGVMVEWGGSWGWDAPHFQLNRSAYPG